MANIRISSLPNEATPSATDEIAIDGTTTRKTTLENAVKAGRPVASQPEAEAGVDNLKAMTPLTTKQAIDAIGGAQFATTAQGSKADTALQPANIGATVQAHDALLDSVSSLSLVAGDIFYATGSNTVARLPIGANGSVLGVTGGLPAWSSTLMDAQTVKGTTPGTTGLAVLGSDTQAEARTAIGIADYATRTEAAAANIVASLDYVRTAGDTSAGDGGGALYKRAASEPTHGGKFQSADGAWWEITDVILAQDYEASNITATPSVDAHSGGDLGASPSGGAPYFNVVVGHGASADGNQWRSTYVGALTATMMDESERTDAYGNGAMRFARYSQRNTAIGSLTLQWLGQEKSRLNELFHDLWWPVEPSDPAWDAAGLETRNPGVKDKLLLVDDAADTDDVRGNVAVGRDAQLHLINGTFNVAVGYRAGARGVGVSNNVAVGRDAMIDNVLGNSNTALGAVAGSEHQEGNVNVYVGYQSGNNHVTGLGNVMVGGGSGTGWTDGDRNVLIGYQSGQGVTQGDDILAIQNLSTRDPLIAGRFNHSAAGINIQPSEIEATFHVRVGAGSGALVNAAADNLFIDVEGTGGITIGNGSSDSSTLYFANPSSNRAGGLLYAHSTGVLAIYAGTVQRVQITDDGLRLLTLPTSATGLSSGQIWNDGGTLKVA
ncbi:hypothetical protein JYP46_01550 [Nitratireductor aquimarinus]|uniref:hypothetical protein n=1 Tax=Alphaproteobacteria TaxID=28211 RepID=UPI0019D383A3|nr:MULTISPECIES: hypothetical protein [Alphaproteobacteria]MBN7755496.1 hypothetical protein [Nitratireductor aquimarinus]MBY5998251.1 hypothetical protein [Tritonibacter mobilis]MBY6020279.1 hypothetical protein [Nitratireductor sp. DP7N14-4]